MKILDIHNTTTKPEIYEKGNAVMWTDEHISKQLLHVHLNKELDLGSRKQGTITSTVDWLLNDSKKQSLNILDLGCGPGLYCELLANKGHKLTGVDFSANSIAHAKKSAKQKSLDINYLERNYLELDLIENSFDLVILIFTDFGVLIPSEREKLLAIIRKILKPDGVFIFDVLSDIDIDKKTAPKNWEVAKSGFWKNEPYLALSESFLYKANKLILFQHMVMDEEENLKTYRFWTQFFSHNDLHETLSPFGFGNLSFHEDVLPKGGMWNGNNVTFCKAVNNK